MRLDKFLKVSRLIKRRTLAKEICDQGRIQINGRPAKASTDVQVNDRLTITFGTKILEVQVQAVAEHVKKEQAAAMYTVLSETKKSDHPVWDEKDDA